MISISTGRAKLAATLLCAGVLAGFAACTRDAASDRYDLGPVKRMNEVEGLSGTFSWPYYTAIAARDVRAKTADLYYRGSAIAQSVTLELAGKEGVEVLTFTSGTKSSAIASKEALV